MLYVPTATADEDSDGRRGSTSASRGRGEAHTLHHLPLSAGRSARARALAGRDLRQRRQHREHARDLARARDRHSDARGVGAGRRPLGRECRDDLLVRARASRTRSGRSSGRWTASASCRERVPALRRRGAAPAALPRAGRRPASPAASQPTTEAALHYVGTELAGGRQLPARCGGLPRHARRGRAAGCEDARMRGEHLQ